MTARAPRVVHVGPHPPIGGGIAKHVERLARLCRTTGITAEVINPYAGVPRVAAAGEPLFAPGGGPLNRITGLLTRLAKSNASIIHIHAARMGRFSMIGHALLALARDRARLITIHGSLRDSWSDYGAFTRRSITKLLGGMDHVILVSEKQLNVICGEIGVPRWKVSVIPAYIAPAACSVGYDEASLPMGALEFVASFQRTAVVAGNVHTAYGFHTMLDAMEQSPASGVAACLVLYGNVDQDYKRLLLQRTANHPRVRIFESLTEGAFLALLGKSKLFVRPTTQEGDSIALREAIACGCQVIASEEFPRPHGTLLFRSGRADQLALAIQAACANPALGRSSVHEDYGANILELYATLSANRS